MLQAPAAQCDPATLLAHGTTGWIHLFGAVSFELFGPLNNVVEHREEFFDHRW